MQKKASVSRESRSEGSSGSFKRSASDTKKGGKAKSVQRSRTTAQRRKKVPKRNESDGGKAMRIPPLSRPEKLEFTQDFIPVKRIRNGIVETTDGRYVKILEVKPINFALLSNSEQLDIIFSFGSWLKIAPVKLQFKIITRRADAESYIAHISKDLENETNENCVALANDHIRLLRSIGARTALTRRFFVIFEYEMVNGARNDYGDIVTTLTNAEATARQYLFGQCGNQIKQSNNPDYDLAEILYTMFNRRSCIAEPFDTRMNRVVVDAMASKNLTIGVDEVPVIRETHFIAPRGLAFDHPNYIVMDGQYYCFLYVIGDGYPGSVEPGWLSSLINAGEGIDVDIHLTKVPRGKAVDKVGQKIRLNRSKINRTQDTSSDYDTLADAIKSGYYIKKSIAKNNEDLYYICIFITLRADTYDDMIWLRKEVEDMLKAQDIQTRQCRYKQEEALTTVMPFNQVAPNLKKKASRNIMTSGAAAAYPFTSFEMYDEGGIMFGLNRYNYSMCVIDLFNTKINANANMFIVGSSGAGKTFLMQLMALRMRMRGIQTIIIAPIKGHEYKRACAAIGGQYIKLAPGALNCINIMEIRHTVSPEMELIDADGYADESLLAKKIQEVLTLTNLLVTDLTNEEEQMVDEALIQTYADFGINFDNDSAYLDSTANPPIMKLMPTLGDLQKRLEANPMTKRVATIMSRVVTGSARTFNGQTNVDLNNMYIVIDLSSLSQKLLPVGMFVAAVFVYDVVKSDIMMRKAVFMDEIWKMLGATANRFAAEFCLDMFKVIRGYGGAAIGSTQDLRDFFGLDDGSFGHGIINACQNKIILGLKEDEAQYVADSLKLTDVELKSICRFRPGEALVYSNNSKIPVYITASERETELITTDPNQLRILAQRRKAERNKHRSGKGDGGE